MKSSTELTLNKAIVLLFAGWRMVGLG